MIIGCYTRIFPQVECKKCVNISKKYSFFLSRQGQHVFFFTLRPCRDFGHRKDSPFYRYVVPGGTEGNIFQTGFFKKKQILHFTPHLGIGRCNIR